MTEHFCTYFDHRYAAKGLAMWRSLERAQRLAVLHVLCLNEACWDIMATLRLSNVHLYRLSDLEANDPALRHARGNRSLVEYYFTLTPSLPRWLFGRLHDIPRLTYLDADLFFFSSPQPLLQELDSASIGVTEHRFAPTAMDRQRYGRFNVGWLTFRNDLAGRRCLDEWREQCLEWCHDRVEPGRFAEQKYLDDWPSGQRNVRIVQHRGANVAPWNLAGLEVSATDEGVFVDGQPLVFFHAHCFEPASPGRARVLGLDDYQVEVTDVLVTRIFDPYEAALSRATEEMAAPLAAALLVDDARHAAHQIETLSRELTLANAADATSRETSRELETRLATMESDLADSRRMVEELRGAVATSESLLSERTAALLDATTELARTCDHAVRLAQALDQVRLRVDSLEHSRTWRWSRPLRWLARLLGAGG